MMNLKQLKSHPLIGLLPRHLQRRMLSASALEEYPKGSVVYREGDPCTAFYILVTGRCESYRESPEGREIVHALHGPGDSLGERDLLHHYRSYRDSARVTTDSTLLRIEGAELHEVLRRKPRLAGLLNERVNASFRVIQQQAAVRHLGRVATLAALAPGIPLRRAGEMLARTLHQETGDTVLLVNLSPSRECPPLSRWASVESGLNGTFCFANELRQEDGVASLRLFVDGGGADTECIAPFVSHASLHFRYLLVTAVADEIPADAFVEWMVQADVSYPLTRPSTGALYDLKLLARNICHSPKGGCTHLKPILCLKGDERATGYTALLRERCGLKLHSTVHEAGVGRPSNFEPHLRRLAREIGRCRIGLALSSGGARGLAHIGVLQVLEEHGITVDRIAGASMGAYIASIWGYGYDATHMELLARQIERRWGVLRLLDPVFPPRKGFLRGDRARNRLKRTIGGAHFTDLLHPIDVLATRLDTLERAVLKEGEVARAVHASAAIPGVCVPVTIDGIPYVDGGICDPLPVDVLEEEGIETIIAVNTIPTPADLRAYMQQAREEGAGKGGFFSRHLNYFTQGNILDTMMRSLQGSQVRIVWEAAARADVLLQPTCCDGRWHEFSNPGKYIEIGRIEAEEHLDAILALSRRKHHEHTNSQSPLEVTV